MPRFRSGDYPGRRRRRSRGSDGRRARRVQGNGTNARRAAAPGPVPRGLPPVGDLLRDLLRSPLDSPASVADSARTREGAGAREGDSRSSSAAGEAEAAGLRAGADPSAASPAAAGRSAAAALPGAGDDGEILLEVRLRAHRGRDRRRGSEIHGRSSGPRHRGENPRTWRSGRCAASTCSGWPRRSSATGSCSTSPPPYGSSGSWATSRSTRSAAPNSGRKSPRSLEEHFRQGRFTEGVLAGIGRVGDALARHFPRQAGDRTSSPIKVTED